MSFKHKLTSHRKSTLTGLLSFGIFPLQKQRKVHEKAITFTKPHPMSFKHKLTSHRKMRPAELLSFGIFPLLRGKETPKKQQTLSQKLHSMLPKQKTYFHLPTKPQFEYLNPYINKRKRGCVAE